MYIGLFNQMTPTDNNEWFNKQQDVILDRIKHLLHCGFGVNNIYGDLSYGSGRNRTLLSVSCEGLPKVVKYLINDAGADIDLKITNDSHSASKTSLMITFNEIISPDSKYLKKELLEILSLFVKKKGVDCIIDGGQTLLHKACYRQSDEVIKLLLKNGARLDITDDKGKTPQDYYSKLSEIAEELGIKQEKTPEVFMEFVILNTEQG